MFSTNDMFSADDFETIPLPDTPDCYLLYKEYFLNSSIADKLYKDLEQQVPWKQEQVRVYGKTYPTPRLSAWYGDSNAQYAYSGVIHHPLPWREDLQSIQQDLSSLLSVHFNSVLLNYYRDGRDGVGWHSDDEPELGPEPVIASLSLGTTRCFQLRPTAPKSVKKTTLKLHLPHGSLLVMAGKMQHFWQHCLTKERSIQAGRINLTFRCVKPLTVK